MKRAFLAVAFLVFGGTLSAIDDAFARARAIRDATPGTFLVQTRPTGSMKPTFDHRDWLVGEVGSFDAITAGDIILFRRNGGAIVCHRAVKLTRDGWRTKGDAYWTRDADPVTEGNYVGRIVAIVRP
jgi:signal peptidase I